MSAYLQDVRTRIWSCRGFAVDGVYCHGSPRRLPDAMTAMTAVRAVERAPDASDRFRLRREVLAGIDEAIALEPVLLVVQLPVAPALAPAAPRACRARRSRRLRAPGSDRRCGWSTAGARSRTSCGPAAATAGRPESAPRSRCRGSTSPRRESGCAGSPESRARSPRAAAGRPTAARRARRRSCRTASRTPR